MKLHILTMYTKQNYEYLQNTHSTLNFISIGKFETKFKLFKIIQLVPWELRWVVRAEQIEIKSLIEVFLKGIVRRKLRWVKSGITQ
jgi:hypothetical protein